MSYSKVACNSLYEISNEFLRFGFLFRHFSPEHVARKVVDGILHNSHSVFIPWHLPHLLFLEK